MSTVNPTQGPSSDKAAARRATLDKARPAPKAPVFDATKTAIDRQIVKEKHIDAFTAAMLEAQDGDSDEAIGRRVALGSDDDAKKPENSTLERIRKTKPDLSDQSNDSENDDGHPKVSQRAKATNASGKVDTVKSEKAQRESNELQKNHHELMLISSNMDRNQTASYAAQSAARKVQDVLSNELWARDSSRNKRLKIAQILQVS